MADSYLTLVNSGLTKNIAKKLGLPRPAILRRYHPGQPLVPGPVLLIGSSAGTEGLATELLAWGLDVRRHTGPKDKLGAIIAVLDEVSDPADLAEPMLAVGSSLRNLLPGGRVVTISRPASTADAPARAAARQGIEGALRSLAHELRGGATGNGILLDDAVDAQAPSALAALRFFLSGRSAYVDGQFLRIGSPQGELPADFDRPLAGQVAVVTGAARGIGAAIAKVLHRDGARVICVDVPAAGEQLAKVSNETGGTALQLDITSEAAGQKILEHAHSRYGRLDILVHNAGITRDKLLANMDEARWNSVISVNIASQLRINEVLLASELFPQAPRVVSLASTSGIAGNRGRPIMRHPKPGSSAWLPPPRRPSPNAGAPLTPSLPASSKRR
jgi:3-oxoacyl-[acyl-carrier protein] reductase